MLTNNVKKSVKKLKKIMLNTIYISIIKADNRFLMLFKHFIIL